MNELYDNHRDHSPARSPVVVFLMVWVSFGFYGIVSLFQSARLLNSYGPHKPYDLKILRLLIVLFLVIYAICFVAYVFTDSPDPGVSESLTCDQPVERLTHTPGVLYEVRMRGLVPYTARGVVWYQGEDDGRNRQYAEDFSAMIKTVA